MLEPVIVSLFGFQDETVALVEVDAAVGFGAIAFVTDDGTLKPVGAPGRQWRPGAGDVQDVAEFGQEQGVVGRSAPSAPCQRAMNVSISA